MGLVCRVVEERGIATVCLSTARDISAQVRPPRTVFVNFPMGNAFGAPFDSAMQTRILRDCLDYAAQCETAGAIHDLPHAWPESFAFNPETARM